MKQVSNNGYKVTQLTGDLWAIEDITSSEGSIAYLLCGAAEALLVDTGLGLSPVSPVVQQITSKSILVCLTHWHFDHSGGAHEFNNIIGWKSENMQHASQAGVSPATIESEVGRAFLDSIGEKRWSTKPFQGLIAVEEELTLDIGNYHLQIVHTPGHTQDSICLYEPAQQWLFAGDTLYPGPIYLQFADSSPADYRLSLQKLEQYKIKTILPGHNAVAMPISLLVETQKVFDRPGYKSSKYPRLTVCNGAV